jgi:hypothetical protein
MKLNQKMLLKVHQDQHHETIEHNQSINQQRSRNLYSSFPVPETSKQCKLFLVPETSKQCKLPNMLAPTEGRK